jgi:hypothetical protein
LGYPELGERHRTIANNWQNASTCHIIDLCLRRAVAVMDWVDCSPAGLCSDLTGARTAPSYLYSAAEFAKQAADLSAASSVRAHEDERRWRVFHERVEPIQRRLPAR